MGMIFGKSWQDSESGGPEPGSDPDGQNLTQMVSEADLLEAKRALIRALLTQNSDVETQVTAFCVGLARGLQDIE